MLYTALRMNGCTERVGVVGQAGAADKAALAAAEATLANEHTRAMPKGLEMVPMLR